MSPCLYSMRRTKDDSCRDDFTVVIENEAGKKGGAREEEEDLDSEEDEAD